MKQKNSRAKLKNAAGTARRPKGAVVSKQHQKGALLTSVLLTSVLLTAALLTVGASLTSCAGGGQYRDGDYYYELMNAAEELARQLEESYYENFESEETIEKARLAVLIIVDEKSKKTDIVKSISNALQTQLFNPQVFSLLERERIDSMLEEFNMNRSGMVDEVSAAELGSMLGAELVVVGSYEPYLGEYSRELVLKINARIVNLETAEILGIGRVAWVIEEDVDVVNPKWADERAAAAEGAESADKTGGKDAGGGAQGGDSPEASFDGGSFGAPSSAEHAMAMIIRALGSYDLDLFFEHIDLVMAQQKLNFITTRQINTQEDAARFIAESVLASEDDVRFH